MCSIFGIHNFGTNSGRSVDLNYFSKMLEHRGPDGHKTWHAPDNNTALAHNRLAIIDLGDQSLQPMHGPNGTVLVFNGEIYNYQELREDLKDSYAFKTKSDTETILAAYHKYGRDCVQYLRGMFAFAIWDGNEQRLFCARDRFGIKPFYYTLDEGKFAFASEMKALLPFLPAVETNNSALSEYLTFQYTLGDQTLFDGIKQLMPGHFLTVEKGQTNIHKYWDVNYNIDYDSSPEDFEEKLHHLLKDSVKCHLNSDVPVGSYLSGGIDSSLITALAQDETDNFYGSFHGKFTDAPGYDESSYAHATADFTNTKLFETTITHNDFLDNFEKIIYHLDTPVAGPGAFPQYMVSKLASQHVKVVLGGQGGDEIFGGYARYIIAYFEQTIKAAIDGNHTNGNYVVTPESIIPNLSLLQEYKPLLRQFWKEGLFGPLDERYFRLIDRSVDSAGEVDWELFDHGEMLHKFKSIFNSQDNVRKEAYFDKMTHFDFKCLLPALLHVEDRMSMAHGLESRVPILDHHIIELAATIPADIKFPGGKMKHLLKQTFKSSLSEKVLYRRDKMGFPVPLKEWFSGPLKSFVYDVFSSQVASTRGFYDPIKVLETLDKNPQYSRKVWGLLSLELWHRLFHDQQSDYKKLVA